MRDTTVFAVDGKPPEQNRPRAKAQGPRRARGGHRHGRALRAFMITRGASTPRPGRTNRSRRAYQPLAPGVPTARAGRTNRSRRAYQAGSTIGPRGSTLHEHCPIDDEAERPRQARRWRRPGRAPARLRVGGGRKHASPWAYRPRAVGVLTKRRGHTYTAPWAQSRCAPAYSPCAPGVLTLRAGRTHPARRAYSPCAPGVLTLRAGRTHPARRAYSLRALDVLCRARAYCTPACRSARVLSPIARRAYSPCAPVRTHHCRALDVRSPCDAGAYSRLRAWAYSPVRAWAYSPCAPWAYSPNAAPAYSPCAPWVRSRYAPGILALRAWAYSPLRAGRTHPARRSYSSPPHEHCAHRRYSRQSAHNWNVHRRTRKQVHAAQSSSRRTTAKAEGPRGARGEHGHGRALDAFTVDDGGKHAAPWAYSTVALGVPVARRGRTHQTQRAYLHRAMGTVTVRAGHTSPAPWAYTARALGVLGARRSHSAGPHRANTAPSTTKTPTPEPHNRHPGGQRACATQQVFAAQAKPSDQNRTTAKAEGPRGPRREHGHGRALDAFMVTRAQQHRAVGVPTARRGRTSRPPRAYRPLAVGVLAARPGRTRRSPWAYQPPALGVLGTRPGRTRHARWAHSPGALGALAPVHDRTPRVVTPRTLPIDDKAEAPAEHVVGAATAVPRARSELSGGGTTSLPTHPARNRLSPWGCSPRRGRSPLSPWAYSPTAAGVLEPRTGRTGISPWARSPHAVGTVTTLPGHTLPPPWAQSRCALGVPAARGGRTARALRAHSACPHPANTAPARTKRRMPKRRNRRQAHQGPCATQECSGHTLNHPSTTERPAKPEIPIPVKWNSVSGDLEHGFRRSGTLVGA